MTEARQPASFKLTPEPEQAHQDPASASRKPRAVKASDVAVVTPAAIDVFETDGLDPLAPPAPIAPRRPSRLGAIFFGALGLLISLALGLWTEQLIRELFSRTEWLGWLGIALAGVAVLAFVIIVVREAYALARLASVEALRQRAADATVRNDTKAARAAVADLVLHVGKKAETAAGRRAVVDLKGEVIDGADFVRFAEAEILAPLDEQARTLVLDAAKRVSIVTAVSPRALVDIGYVLWESGRLVRKM
jgi:putative membrane protein